MKLELSRQEILALYKDSMSNNRYADDSIIIFSRKLLEEAAKVCDSVAHGVHEAEAGQCASHIRKLIKYHG